MNHKQTNSIITIPFSWEMMPGVPKHMVSPASTSPPLPPPPPGCFREPVLRRSVSAMFWREEDPFLLALKECSKDNYKVKSEKKRFGIFGSKSFMWCKCSFDVEEGNLIRKRTVARSGAPVSPSERVHGLIRIHKGMRNWNT